MKMISREEVVKFGNEDGRHATWYVTLECDEHGIPTNVRSLKTAEWALVSTSINGVPAELWEQVAAILETRRNVADAYSDKQRGICADHGYYRQRDADGVRIYSCNICYPPVAKATTRGGETLTSGEIS